MPDTRSEARPALDWRGFGLTAVGVTALLVGMENIGMGPSNWTIVATGLILSAISLSGAVAYLLRTARPLGVDHGAQPAFLGVSPVCRGLRVMINTGWG